MSSKNKLIIISACLTLSGCGAYQLGPLSFNHPAHPDAPAGPERPASTTLSYTRADVPSPAPVLAVSADQRPGHKAHAETAETGGQKTVVGEGKVIATVPSANQVVLEHGEITGFMEAMTMGYQVDPPSLLDGLKQGDKVRFTIDIPKKTIMKIEKMQ